jgi:hypothetical protein
MNHDSGFDDSSRNEIGEEIESDVVKLLEMIELNYD